MVNDNILKETAEVSSSAVFSISYEHETKSMFITFVSGVCYVYNNVDYNDFILLKNSNSIGSFFNKHIKNKYVWEVCK